MNRVGLVIVVCVSALSCAQVRTSSEVTVVPKKGGKKRVIGATTGQVVRRGVEARWSQEVGVLQVDLTELRECQTFVHEPVVRIDRISRKPDGAIYWEYGLAAVLLGVGITALAAPEKFSSRQVTSEGNVIEDPRPGYRIGGIFTGIGALFLGAAIYDTVRSRDEVRYADAYRLQPGDDVACAAAQVPASERDVELIIGEWRKQERTDENGRVRFALPSEDEVHEQRAPEDETDAEPEPEPEPPTPEPEPEPTAPAPEDPNAPTEEVEPTEPVPVEPTVHKGVLRMSKRRALAVDFVIPYRLTAEEPHTGEARLEPE